MTLETITRRAHRDATREGRILVILNLNPVGAPLYVIREAWPGCETARGFVALIPPSETE